MVEVHMESAICTMVEAMLPRFSPEDICLAIQVDMRFYLHEEDRCASEIITLVFQRPSNYTKVFAAYGRGFAFEHDYDFESDHDSCWRDGVGRILRKVEELLREELIEGTDIEHPFDKRISPHVSFGIFSPKYYKCEVVRHGHYESRITLSKERRELTPGQVESVFHYPKLVEKDMIQSKALYPITNPFSGRPGYKMENGMIVDQELCREVIDG